MKRLLQLLPLVALAACAPQSDLPNGVDTSAATTSALEPEIPEAAQALVGRWQGADGSWVEFMQDGTYRLMADSAAGMGDSATVSKSWRTLDDSLVVSDSAILNVSAVPATGWYRIEQLTGDSLVLSPDRSALGGRYTRME